MTEVTDWLTAIGTCGAVTVSLWLALKEMRDKRKRDERHQAELVTAWFVPYKDEDGEAYSGLRVHNASNQMIYDVVAEVLIRRKTAVNDTEERNIGFGAMVGNVPPGGFTARIHREGMLGAQHLIEFAFQDAAGRYWLRHANGKLERVRKHPLDLFNLTDAGVRWQTEEQ
jgi:hypothetical protein